MSDYVRIHDFSAKDALTSGDPNKLIKGSEVDAEFDQIVTDMSTKYDSSDIATQIQAEAESLNTVLMTPQRVGEWADANAGIVGDLQALADPDADRLVVWDDSAGAAVFMTAGNQLSISGTSLDVDDGAGSSLDADLLDAQEGSFYQNSSNQNAGTLPDPRLSSNVPLLDQSNTFTGQTLMFENVTPVLYWHETDASANEGEWRLFANGGGLTLQSRADGDGAGESILEVSRSGVAISSVAFSNGAVSITDSLAIGGGQAISDSDNVPLLDQNNTFTGVSTFEGGSPVLNFHETGATANEGEWRFIVDVDKFFFQTRTDGDGAGETVLSISRTGATVGTISFPNGAVSITDSLAIGGGQAISDSDNIALLNGEPVFTSNVEVGRVDPRFILDDTDAATDEGRWDINVLGGQFRIETRNDAGSGAEALITATRTGSSIDTVNVVNGTLEYGGVEVGFREMQVTEQNGNYTTDADDSHGLVYKDAGGAGETITIDGSDYSTGAVISFVNNGGGDLTIAIQDDTLHQAGTGSTGSRTLADHGMATAVKVDASNWFISGTGLS